MIFINLLPEDLRKKDTPKLSMPEIPIRGTLITVIAVLVGAQIFLLSAALYEKISLSNAQREVTALRETNREVARRKAETATMKKHLNGMAALTGRKVQWATLLNALSDSMTQGVWLTSLSVQKTPASDKEGVKTPAEVSLRLEGSAVGSGEELAAISEFMRTLKASEKLSAFFSEIKHAASNQKKIKDQDVYDFVILCSFKPESTEIFT